LLTVQSVVLADPPWNDAHNTRISESIHNRLRGIEHGVMAVVVIGWSTVKAPAK